MAWGAWVCKIIAWQSLTRALLPFALSLSKGRSFFITRKKKNGASTSSARTDGGNALAKKIIVIDEGTTSTRTMLFAADGTPLGSAQREIRQHYPGHGLVEQIGRAHD